MTLFELTRRNAVRNFRLYGIYFVSMVISVMIYFTFVALSYNDSILGQLKYADAFKLGMMIASTVTLLFIAVFVLYANGFFMRHRKKELGMYLVLGMKERQVSLMIFYANLIIAAASLLIGGALGGILSKLFAMIILRLMVYHAPISITFPLPAIMQTAAVFAGLALIVSLQAHLTIRRVKLKDLFQAAGRTQRPIRVSVPLALLSVLLLGGEIYCITQGWGSRLWSEYTAFALIVTAIGIVGGTYLFFRQFIALLLWLLSKTKRYAESDRLLWLSSIRFQVRDNASNLTFIALFSTALLFFVAFVAVNYQVQFTAVKQNLPNTFAYESIDAAAQRQVDETIDGSGFEVLSHETLQTVPAEPVSDLETAFENPTYFTDDIALVPASVYNRIADERGDSERIVELDGNEALSLSLGMDEMQPVQRIEPTPFRVQAGGETVELSLVLKLDYSLLGWQSGPGINMFGKQAILVVSDEQYDRLAEGGALRYYELYQLDDEEHTTELSKQLYALAHREGRYFSSYADVYAAQIESSSALLFGGAFLACIALFSLASVIYFKQLREATEAKGRFRILRRIGITAASVQSVIRKQLAFVFFPALLVGVGHGGLIFKYYIYDSLSDYDLTGVMLLIVGIYGAIYSVLYLSAIRVYHNIIREP